MDVEHEPVVEVVEEPYTPATGSFIPRQIVLGIRDGDAYERLTDGSLTRLSEQEAIELHKTYPVQIAPRGSEQKPSVATMLSQASADWIHNNLMTLLANASASKKTKKRWREIAEQRLAELRAQSITTDIPVIPMPSGKIDFVIIGEDDGKEVE